MTQVQGVSAPLRQVENVVLNQGQSIGILMDRILELRERLSGALRPEPCCKGETADRNSLVPIAENVRNNTDKIETCTDMITDILERLEIG